jgi:hypothetical protein
MPRPIRVAIFWRLTKSNGKEGGKKKRTSVGSHMAKKKLLCISGGNVK